jgi:2,6-dihydroxypseudooxynicotine hydrolase
MPDDQVTAAIAHWGPRMIQNGVDYNAFARTCQRISEWEDWLPAWNETADEYAEFADACEKSGHKLTAGEAWRRASVSRHFGKFVWTVDLDLAAKATHRSVQEMLDAHRLLDPAARRIKSPGAVANLRRPPGAKRPPWVVLIPGLDSTKEEFFFLEKSFLDRGMATVSVDGPGQGETGLMLPIRPDYEAAISPLMDVLLARDDLDPDRVGICGVSLGGYYAPRVAAFDKRFKAVVGISGPFCFGDLWGSLPPMTRSTFVVKSRAANDADGRIKAGALNLADVCGRIKVPALYVTGKLDRLIPWTQTQRQADESPLGTFVCFERGNHGVSNLPDRARPVIADWMADQLGLT